MKRNVLFAAITIAAMGCVATTDAQAKKEPKAGHKFKASIEVQYRTNDNISVAPGSGEQFDYAELGDFGIEDEDEEGTDDSEEEDDDESDDGFDDLVDVEPSEDELEEDDAVDEDGDGIDDLIDPNADVLVDKETRFTTKLAFGHKYTFADGATTWNNGLRLATDTHNQRDELDKFNWAITTGIDYSPKGSRHAFKSSLSYVGLEKDDKEFATTFVVSLGYSFEVSKRLELSATYNYQDKDVAKPTSPDARVDTLALGLDFKATDDDIFKFKYAPKIEDSSQVTRDTDAWGWELTYTRKLPWDMTAGIGYRFDSVDHVNLAPRRQDDNRTWGLQLTKDFGDHLSIELGYETRDRSSNIAGKDAANDSFYLGGTWKF